MRTPPPDLVANALMWGALIAGHHQELGLVLMLEMWAIYWVVTQEEWG